MKVLVLALNFSPEIVGCAKFTTEFVDWFSKKAKKIIVITTNPFYPEWEVKSNRYKKSNNKNILIIRCPIYVPKKLNGMNRILHYLSFSITSFPIILYYGLKDIDLGFIMCPTILSAPNLILISLIKKIFSRKKFVTWIHYADLEIEAAFKLNLLKGQFLRRFLIFIEKRILSNFDFISSISFYMLEKIKLNTSKNNKLFYLPNFIDTKQFNNIYANNKITPFSKELGLKEQKVVIMYSGSINEKMACNTLINSIKNLAHRKDLIWIISGDGPKKNFLKQNLKDLKNVLFYNFQPINKLPYWLDLGDIHLIPQKLSSVEYCLPSKLIGILAIGKPVIGITRKNSELGKILDKYGVRLNSESPEEMSKAIIKLVENKELRKKLSNKSKIYVEELHEKENILNNMYRVVEKMISTF